MICKKSLGVHLKSIYATVDKFDNITWWIEMTRGLICFYYELAFDFSNKFDKHLFMSIKVLQYLYWWSSYVYYGSYTYTKEICHWDNDLVIFLNDSVDFLYPVSKCSIPALFILYSVMPFSLCFMFLIYFNRLFAFSRWSYLLYPFGPLFCTCIYGYHFNS